MWPEWRTELRSNRWHFARRWARLRPVVMIQPERASRESSTVEPEPRIDNCQILSIVATEHLERWVARSIHQTTQIGRYMRSAGHRQPLFWGYNPCLLMAYAALPAILRVYHATENYFDCEGLPPAFHEANLLMLSVSDRIVAVSSCVADEMQARLPACRVSTNTTGCDCTEYSTVRTTSRLTREAVGFQRIAIYAGNINSRIDFELLAACVARERTTLFILIGPAATPDLASSGDLAGWEMLLVEPNVRYLGPVDPDELPHLYGAADVGIIPYKRTLLLERNGFPLKALEMLATGLPVVSSYMRPLEEVSDVVMLAHDHEAFLTALAGTSRERLTVEQRERMVETCRARDYDAAFDRLLTILAGDLPSQGPLTRLDGLSCLPRNWWLEALTAAEPVSPPEVGQAGPVGRALRSGWRLLPSQLRRKAPAAL